MTSDVSLTTVPARLQLYTNAHPSDFRPLLLASMTLYRCFNDVTGVLETNPYALPPADFLLRVISDGTCSTETRIMAGAVLQQGALHQMYQLNKGQRDLLVRGLAQSTPQHDTVPSWVEQVMNRFSIKSHELTVVRQLLST